MNVWLAKVPLVPDQWHRILPRASQYDPSSRKLSLLFGNILPSTSSSPSSGYRLAISSPPPGKEQCHFRIESSLTGVQSGQIGVLISNIYSDTNFYIPLSSLSTNELLAVSASYQMHLFDGSLDPNCTDLATDSASSPPQIYLNKDGIANSISSLQALPPGSKGWVSPDQSVSNLVLSDVVQFDVAGFSQENWFGGVLFPSATSPCPISLQFDLVQHQVVTEGNPNATLLIEQHEWVFVTVYSDSLSLGDGLSASSYTFQFFLERQVPAMVYWSFDRFPSDKSFDGHMELQSQYGDEFQIPIANLTIPLAGHTSFHLGLTQKDSPYYAIVLVAATSALSSSSSIPSQKSTTETHIGAIVGIVLGGVSAILIAVGAVVVIYRRRKKFETQSKLAFLQTSNPVGREYALLRPEDHGEEEEEAQHEDQEADEHQ